MTDAELVRLSRDGQTAAQEQLVRRYSPRMLAVCRARVGRQDAAEDLTQETLIRGLTHLDTLEHPEKVGAWLRGIAIRVCLDWLRSRGRRQVAFSDVASSTDVGATVVDAADSQDVRIEQQERREQLYTEIDALPDDLREPLLLYYYDEVTYEQIADLLGVSRATVNTRLSKARAQLARRLAHLTR